MKAKPLDDLELFELLRAAYPEKFKDDDDETWNAAQSFADDIAGWQDVADLLGRVGDADHADGERAYQAPVALPWGCDV